MLPNSDTGSDADVIAAVAVMSPATVASVCSSPYATVAGRQVALAV